MTRAYCGCCGEGVEDWAAHKETPKHKERAAGALAAVHRAIGDFIERSNEPPEASKKEGGK